MPPSRSGDVWCDAFAWPSTKNRPRGFHRGPSFKVGRPSLVHYGRTRVKVLKRACLRGCGVQHQQHNSIPLNGARGRFSQSTRRPRCRATASCRPEERQKINGHAHREEGFGVWYRRAATEDCQPVSPRHLGGARLVDHDRGGSPHSHSTPRKQSPPERPVSPMPRQTKG